MERDRQTEVCVCWGGGGVTRATKKWPATHIRSHPWSLLKPATTEPRKEAWPEITLFFSLSIWVSGLQRTDGKQEGCPVYSSQTKLDSKCDGQRLTFRPHHITRTGTNFVQAVLLLLLFSRHWSRPTGYPPPLPPTTSLKEKDFHRLCFSAHRSCVKDEVAVLGSPSPIVPTVSVDVKQQWARTVTYTRDVSFRYTVRGWATVNDRLCFSPRGPGSPAQRGAITGAMAARLEPAVRDVYHVHKAVSRAQ